MHRRDLSKALFLASSVGAAGFVKQAEAQQTCTTPCYPPLSPAENNARVVQTQYPPGDLRRYYDPQHDADYTLALGYLSTVASNNIACFIPAGTYPYISSPNWAIPNLQLAGEPGTILMHTGSGVAFNIDNGPPPPPSSPGTPGLGAAHSAGLNISNLIISGNSNTTDGFYARGLDHSVFSNIEVRNCTGRAFNILWGVANLFQHCLFSTNVFNSTVLPVRGFRLDQNSRDQNPSGYYSAGNTFIGCIAEGVPGIGCELAYASGNSFVGCIFEGVGIGLSIDSPCQHNHFTNAWFEANTIGDARINGDGNGFTNCNFGTSGGEGVQVISAAGTVFHGGFLNRVNLQSTSRFTVFLGSMFSPGGLTANASGIFKSLGSTYTDTGGGGVPQTWVPDVP